MKCSVCGKEKECHSVGPDEMLCKECLLDRSVEFAEKDPEEAMALSLERIAIFIRARRDATDDMLFKLKRENIALKAELRVRRSLDEQ